MSKEREIPDADIIASKKLDTNLSAVITQLYTAAGMSQTELAAKLGYTRATISNLLNDNDVGRQWKLVTLCGVSRVFRVPVSALLIAAESGKPIDMTTVGTEKASPERLQRLIYAAVGYSGDIDKSKFDGVQEVLFRVRDLFYACPEWYQSYLNGDISDTEASAVLEKAAGIYADQPGGMPFWAALKNALAD